MRADDSVQQCIINRGVRSSYMNMDPVSRSLVLIVFLYNQLASVNRLEGAQAVVGRKVGE